MWTRGTPLPLRFPRTLAEHSAYSWAVLESTLPLESVMAGNSSVVPYGKIWRSARGGGVCRGDGSGIKGARGQIVRGMRGVRCPGWCACQLNSTLVIYLPTAYLLTWLPTIIVWVGAETSSLPSRSPLGLSAKARSNGQTCQVGESAGPWWRAYG